MVTVPAILTGQSCILHCLARRNEIFEKKAIASYFMAGESDF
jgi:hypothetical protein